MNNQLLTNIKEICSIVDLVEVKFGFILICFKSLEMGLLVGVIPFFSNYYADW
jgi:hypothetical protein